MKINLANFVGWKIVNETKAFGGRLDIKDKQLYANDTRRSIEDEKTAINVGDMISLSNGNNFLYGRVDKNYFLELDYSTD